MSIDQNATGPSKNCEKFFFNLMVCVLRIYKILRCTLYGYALVLNAVNTGVYMSMNRMMITEK